MMKHPREKIAVDDDELTYIDRNSMMYHVHLVTKKSFEESVQLGMSETGELKRCLDFVNFPVSCSMSLWPSDAMKSLQRYERALAKLFSETSYVQVNVGGHHLENIFCGCMNVEMAKLKLGLMPELEKPKDLA